MISFELNIIDWNAVSAIATTLALIVAFVTIIVSNCQERKNRKLQVLLLHKDQQQKQLDEMVTNLLAIIDDINPLHLANYSKKIENRTITVQDREQLDKIANTDQSNYNKLQIQLIKLNNHAEAKPLLNRLGVIREEYGTWIRGVTALLFNIEDNRCIQTKPTDTFINDIINKCISIDPKSVSFLKEYQQIMKTDFVQGFINIVLLHSYLCTGILLKEKKIFMEDLKLFVKKEQLRIDNIVSKKI